MLLHMFLLATGALLGDMEMAWSELAESRRLSLDPCISFATEYVPFQCPKAFDRLVKGLKIVDVEAVNA